MLVKKVKGSKRLIDCCVKRTKGTHPNSLFKLSAATKGICRPTDSIATTQYAVKKQTIFIINMF